MIGLRQVQDADSEQLRTWRNMPEVSAFMYSDHVISEEEHAAWFTAALADPARRYWIITVDGEDVGLVNVYGIDEVHSRAVWAFYLASASVRGRGVGSYVEFKTLSYVFDELDLHRLTCEVLTSNPAVIDMHVGFGFTVEGTLRQHIRKGDAFVDVALLGMLRDEWTAKRPALEEKLRGRGLL